MGVRGAQCLWAEMGGGGAQPRCQVGAHSRPFLPPRSAVPSALQCGGCGWRGRPVRTHLRPGHGRRAAVPTTVWPGLPERLPTGAAPVQPAEETLGVPAAPPLCLPT